jgi:hypothetical protein
MARVVCCPWGATRELLRSRHGALTQGAHSSDCSMSCANRHIAVLSRTLCQALELSVLFRHPTGPHLAAFILPSLGRRCGGLRPPFLCGPSPNCDQTNTRPSAPGSRLHAGSLQSICRVFGDRTCIPYRQVGPKPFARATTAVSVFSRSDAGDTTNRSTRRLRPHSDSMIAGHTIDVQLPRRNARRCVARHRCDPFRVMAE